MVIVIKEVCRQLNNKIKIFIIIYQLTIKLRDVAGIHREEEFKLKEDQNVLSITERRTGKNTPISGEGITDENAKQN